MDYNYLAHEIILYVGGKQNINNISFNVTRLKFYLKELSRVDKNKLVKVNGVYKVLFINDECHLIVGNKVESFLLELEKIFYKEEAKENFIDEYNKYFNSFY